MNLSAFYSRASRLDWMYEQSSATLKPNEDELMNMPVTAQKACFKGLRA